VLLSFTEDVITLGSDLQTYIAINATSDNTEVPFDTAGDVSFQQLLVPWSLHVTRHRARFWSTAPVDGSWWDCMTHCRNGVQLVRRRLRQTGTKLYIVGSRRPCTHRNLKKNTIRNTIRKGIPSNLLLTSPLPAGGTPARPCLCPWRRLCSCSQPQR